MIALALPLALVLATVDPCAPVAGSSPPDAAAAALYREAGDAEAARGAPDTAAVAYARAASFDAGDTASRDALRRLCSATTASEAPGAFEEGQRRMDAGDLRAAAKAFARARATGDRSAALLEGVCLFRLGEDGPAEVALRDAELAPPHRDLARFYLGLLAFREGQAGRAAGLFEAASADPALSTMAGTMARAALRDGRLVLSLSLQSGLDSNVALASKGSSGSGAGTGMMGGGTLGMMNGDGLYDVAAAALWRPEGPVGPFVRLAGGVHRYFQEGAFDLATADAAAGWQLARDGMGLLGEVGYRNQRFGSSPYLQAGRAAASGWLSTGDVTWSLGYAATLQRYATSFTPFDGTLQHAEARVAWAAGPRWWLAAGWGASRDSARSVLASYREQGPRLELRAVLSPVWRAGLAVGVTWRRYQGVDAALGVGQSDTFLDGTAFVERDLAGRWTARLGLDGRDTSSTLAAAAYARLVPTAGLVYVFGL